MPAKPPPAGWPRLSAAVFYTDPLAMIDWLQRAFGFSLRLKVLHDDGTLAHSELVWGDDAHPAVIMVGTALVGDEARFGTPRTSPRVAGFNTQNLMLYVDDVDAHCATARANGAVVVAEPELHDYGDGYWADRAYGAIDPEGHLWWVVQRVRG
jgi:uncharacterized glyoxalase superfamily protein PhnB